jgi:hypothetical protein
VLCYEHHVEMKIGRARLELRDGSVETPLYDMRAPCTALSRVFLPRASWPAIRDKLQFPAGNLPWLPKGFGPELPIWPLASFEVFMLEW